MKCLFNQSNNQFTLPAKVLSSFLAFLMVFSTGIISCYAMGAGVPEKLELENALSNYIEEIVDLDGVQSIDEENTSDNELYFNMKDDTTTVYTFSEAVTYIDEDGKLRCKDNSIIEQRDKEKENEGYDYSNGQNDYRINFSSDSSKGVLVEYGDVSFSLAPISDKSAPGYVSNGEINNERFEDFEYADLHGENTLLKYFPQINGVKEIITLDYKIEENTFKSMLKTNGCEPVINEDGSVSLLSTETDEEVQNFTAPFAFDTAYVEGIEDSHFCSDCYYGLEKVLDNEYILSVTVSDEWLNSDKTVYPVTIDPTTSNISNLSDAGVYSEKSSNNYGNEQTCGFGRASEYGYGRVYTQFAMPTAIAKYATINSAYIWERETTGRTTTTYVTPYMVGESWNETTITWNNKALYNLSTAMTKKNINSKSTDDSTNSCWYKFDIKTAVQKWSDGAANYGLVFISNEESNGAYNWRAFTSRTYSSSAMRPYTVINYTNDTTAPTAPTVTGNPTSWTNQSIMLTAKATDEASGVEYYSFSTTKGTYSWQASAIKTVTANGTYYVYAKDKAGNISEPTTVTVNKIDKTKPSAPTVTGNPTSWVKDKATLTASSKDADSGVVSYSFSTTEGTYSWQTSNTKTVTENGTYYVYARDATGLISDPTTITVRKIDNVAPSTPTVGGNPTIWTNEDITLTASSIDLQSGSIASGVVAYSFSTIKGTYIWQTSNTKTVTKNETYYVYAKDAVGNISDATTVVVNKIDKEGPSAPTVTQSITNWTKASIILTASSTDAATEVEYYSFSTTKGEYAWQTSAKKTVENNAIYYVYAKDRLGNISEPTVFSVNLIDKTAPTILSVSGNPTSWVTNDIVTLIVKAEDTQSGIAAYSFSTTKGTYYWQTSASKEINANATYYIYVKDAVGNISNPTTVTVNKIENKPPTVPKVTQTPNSWTSGDIVLTAKSTDSQSGVVAYSFSKKEGTYSWQTDTTYTVKENETYYVYAKDAVGNISAAATVVVSNIDRIVPKAPEVKLSPSSWTNKNVLLTATAEDDLSGVEYYSFSTEKNVYSWKTTKTNTVTENGTYYVYAKDKAGNISEVTTVVVDKIDRVEPIINSVSMHRENYYDIEITIDAEDVPAGDNNASSGIGQYSSNGSVWYSNNTLRVNSYAKEITVYVRDNAGNVSSKNLKVSFPEFYEEGSLIGLMNPDSDQKMEYKIGENGKWHDYVAPFTVPAFQETDVYARFEGSPNVYCNTITSKTDYYGAYSESNIDFTLSYKTVSFDFLRCHNSVDRNWFYSIDCMILGPGIDWYEAELPDGRKLSFIKQDDTTFVNELTGCTLSIIGNDNLIEITDGDITYVYDGYLLSAVKNNKYGDTITITRTSDNIYVSDETGRSYVLDLSEYGKILKITDPENGVITYSYNCDDSLNTVVDQTGVVISEYSYEDRAITKTKDKSINYDENNSRVSSICYKNGKSISYSYDDKNLTISTSSSDNTTTSETYNDAFYVISLTDEDGNTTKYDYDEYYRITTEKSNGKTISYIYDDNGNASSEESTDGEKTCYSYDDNNQMIRQQIGDDYTYYVYNEKGEVIISASLKENYTGNIPEAYDENLNCFDITKYTYVNGLLKKSVNDNETTIYEYDEYGNTVKMAVSKTENGATTVSGSVNTYDLFGNVLTATNGDETSFYIYDAAGRILLANENGECTRTLYDNCGRIIQEISPEDYDASKDGLPSENTYADSKAGHTYSYNDKNQLVSETNRIGKTTEYSYNDVGHKENEKFDLYTFHYLNGGELESVDVNEEEVISYDYDENQRLSAQIYANGETIRYTYNDNGDVAEQYHNSNAKPYVIYTYNRDNELTEKVNKDTGLKYVYDKNGQVSVYKDNMLVQSYSVVETAADEEAGTEGFNTVTENHFGNVYTSIVKDKSVSFTADNKTVEYSYQILGEEDNEKISSDVIKNGEITALSSLYSYDDNSNVIKKAIVYNGGTVDFINSYDDKDRIASSTSFGKTVKYTYDKDSQLVASHRDDYSASYSYDDRGNITSKTVNDETTSFVYNDTGWIDQLIEVDGVELSYDENGNVLTYGDREYTWNSGRHLESIIDAENECFYTYDENGIRTSKTVNDITTYYNTLNGVILSQADGTNTMYFQYGTSSTPLGFIYNGIQYFYVTNQMNDVVGIADIDGNLIAQYLYDDWGKLLSIDTVDEEGSSVYLDIANANPIRYRGYYYDNETGYYYLQSRYYDANICRFINADIIGISQLSKNLLLGVNLYLYCVNDAVNNTDPSGCVVETIVDVASIGWSLYDFIKQPSWMNFGFLVWDVAAACIPFVPGSYTAKGGKIVVKIASKINDLKAAKYLQLGKYKDLKKLFKGVKGIEIHHILEKRFQKNLFKGIKQADFMSIPLTKELHKTITDRWRKAIPYGTNYSKVTYAQMEKAVKDVYFDMPELKKQALQWFKKYWRK